MLHGVRVRLSLSLTVMLTCEGRDLLLWTEWKQKTTQRMSLWGAVVVDSLALNQIQDVTWGSGGWKTQTGGLHMSFIMSNSGASKP